MKVVKTVKKVKDTVTKGVKIKESGHTDEELIQQLVNEELLEELI